MDINTLNTLGAVGAVIISVIGYVISYFKTKNNIAKAKEKEAVDIAVKEVNLNNRLELIENDLKGYSKLNETLEKLDCTLEGIKLVLAEHKIEIKNLKESK